MTILSVLLIAAWFLLAGGQEAHAGFLIPIFTAIGSAISALGFVGQLLIGTALKIGLGLLERALQPKQKEPGVQTKITTGGDNPLSFMMGAFADAGQLEYVNTWGEADKTPNAYLTMVISIGDLPLPGGLTGLWINDKHCTVPDMSGAAPADQGYPVAEYVVDGTPYLWITFHDGTDTAVDPFLAATFGADPDRPWTDDMIGRGVPYAIMTMRLNSGLFSGTPTFIFESDGIALYDIRKDSTRGGSGSHRLDDPSTFEPSSNPIVQAYNIARGIWYGDEWVYGGQTTQAYQLPAANWITAANACDATITNADGSTEARYRSGCNITTDQVPLDVIKSLMKGCSGRFVEAAGLYKVTVGGPGASVYSFDDGNIVITQGQSLDPFPGLDQTYNGASASYPEPAEKWGNKDAPAYRRTDLEALDDNRFLPTGLQFPTVPYALQIQRLLQEAVQDARRFRQHQFYLPPEAFLLEPIDTIAYTSDHNSYDEKKFILDRIADASNCLQQVTLKEVDPSDFTWNPLTDERPYSIGFVGPILPPAQDFAGWAVEPYTFTDAAGGDRRPGILVKADGDLDDVEFVRVQVRRAATTTVLYDAVKPYGNPVTNPDPLQYPIEFGGIIHNTAYQARGLLEPYSGRATNWSDWLDVTTPNVLLGDQDVYLPGLVAQINDDLAAGLAPLQATNLRDQFETARNIARSALNQDAGQYLDKQTTITQQQAAFGTITADYKLEVQTWAGPGSSLAQTVATLTATIPSLATVTALSATTARVTSLEGTTSLYGGRLDTIEATLPDKANVSALNATNATVSSQGDAINAQGDLISGIQATLPNKADVTALNTTNVNVSNLQDTVTAQGTTISGLQSTVGNFSASGLFRTAVTTTESGASATIAIGVSATSGGAMSTAALLMSAVAGGDSMLGLVASKVYMTDGAGNKAYPFVFSGSVMRANFADIGTITAGVIQSPDGLFVQTLSSGEFAWYENV